MLSHEQDANIRSSGFVMQPLGERQMVAPGRSSPLLPSSAVGIGLLAKFFRALGDPVRLRLLEFLLDEEHTVTECVSLAGVSQGRVSTHLACLADCGFVQVRREGRYAYYRVSDQRVAELVMSAHLLATDNARALAGCLRIDAEPGEPG
jgi:ArsR family transcriptional regulator, cadmium/lead-responsive transcriptional repressor